jgi:hypothetical protein
MNRMRVYRTIRWLWAAIVVGLIAVLMTRLEADYLGR